MTGAVIISCNDTYRSKVADFLGDNGRLYTDLRPDAEPIPVLREKLKELESYLRNTKVGGFRNPFRRKNTPHGPITYRPLSNPSNVSYQNELRKLSPNAEPEKYKYEAKEDANKYMYLLKKTDVVNKSFSLTTQEEEERHIKTCPDVPLENRKTYAGFYQKR